MKKKNVILCVGILFMMMLGGCGDTTNKEDSTSVTKETQETKETEETEETEEAKETEEATETKEATETQETDGDSKAELSSIMTEIYGVGNDAANAEAVAEKLKNYAFSYGAPSSSSAFKSIANDWFKTMEETEGKDIRSEFSVCFETVTSAVNNMDETIRYDVAYSNVINGIRSAIEE